jgi:hypothetical protein
MAADELAERTLSSATSAAIAADDQADDHSPTRPKDLELGDQRRDHGGAAAW